MSSVLMNFILNKETYFDIFKRFLPNFDVLKNNECFQTDTLLHKKLFTAITMVLASRINSQIMTPHFEKDFYKFKYFLNDLVSEELSNSKWYNYENRIFEIFDVFIFGFTEIKEMEWFIDNKFLHKKLYLVAKLGMMNKLQFHNDTEIDFFLCDMKTYIISWDCLFVSLCLIQISWFIWIL